MLSQAQTIAENVDRLPPVAAELDVEGWLAWMLCGLPLFTHSDLPTLRSTNDRVRLLLAVLAMARNQGNFTHAAEQLQTSRRLIRDSLDEAGLYPWHGLVRRR